MIRYFIAAALFSTVSVAQAATVNFVFKVPTAREDGTKLAVTELDTCRLYEVASTGTTKVADMGVTGSFTLTVTGTTTKTYAADCIDTRGVTSKLSAPVSVPLSPPLAPTITITISTN